MRHEPYKVIFDTDPGVDDAMALYFALAHPDIDVIGITTTFGNVAVEQAAVNALYLTALVGVTIPVTQGIAAPLTLPPPVPPAHVHGADGLGNLPARLPVQATLDPRSSARFIVDMARAQPGEITLVAVGPLGNLALALAIEPRLPHLLREVILMGGTVLEPGNVSAVAEANIANDPHAVLPDRAQVSMAEHFMRSYSRLAIKTCHRRNVHAMGGMSAYIPIKSDPVANDKAIAQVRADKEREAGDGHDGTWVAHPGLVPVAMEIFNRLMPQPNQISKQLPHFHATAEDLLQVPEGQITEAGLKQNVAVGLGYIEAWLRGIGCVPLFNLMEDAATAEISRAQLWQWVHQKARLRDGRIVELSLVEGLIASELDKQKVAVDAARFVAYEEAADLMRQLVSAPQFVEFLTLQAYQRVLKDENFSAA